MILGIITITYRKRRHVHRIDIIFYASQILIVLFYMFAEEL